MCVPEGTMVDLKPNKLLSKILIKSKGHSIETGTFSFPATLKPSSGGFLNPFSALQVNDNDSDDWKRKAIMGYIFSVGFFMALQTDYLSSYNLDDKKQEFMSSIVYLYTDWRQISNSFAVVMKYAPFIIFIKEFSRVS